MTIDVVLANHNHGHRLLVALEALSKQRFAANRIIVVDDFSSDDSLSLLESFRGKIPNLMILKNKMNLGAVASYNIGFRYVESRYVYFAAADDTVNENLFSTCTNFLDLYPMAAFASAEVNVYEDDSSIPAIRPIIRPRILSGYISPFEVEREFNSNDNWIMTGACVFRTEFVRTIGCMRSELGPFADSIMAKTLAFRHGCVFVPYIGSNWNLSKHGYSRGIFDNFEIFTRTKQLLEMYIQSSSFFPNWYWRKFSKRLDFSNLRLSLQKSHIDGRTLEVSVGKTLKWVYSFSNKSKGMKHILLLVAYLKLQPFSFHRFLTTKIERFLTTKTKRALELIRSY